MPRFEVLPDQPRFEVIEESRFEVLPDKPRFEVVDDTKSPERKLAEGVGKDLLGVGASTAETALGLASGAANFLSVTPVAGIAGLSKLISSKLLEGKSVDESLAAAGETTEGIQSKFQYQPKTDMAQQSLEKVGEGFEFVGTKAADLSEYLGGGPNLQAATKTVGDLATILALGGRKGKKGVKQPTKAQIRNSLLEEQVSANLQELINRSKEQPENILRERYDQPPAIDLAAKLNELKIDTSKSEYGTKAKDSKVRTIRGWINAQGGVAPGNFKGEVKNMPVGSKRMFKKDGIPIDSLEQAAIAEGWMTPGESLLDNIGDSTFLKRGKLTQDIATKRLSERTKQDQEVAKPHEYEAPPEGEYKVRNAEDLPGGEKITLIDKKSKRGWGEYTIKEKDPFEIVLEGDETIKLGPLDKVEVLGKGVAKKPIEAVKEIIPEEVVKPEPIEVLESKAPEEVTEQIPFTALTRKKATGAESVGPITAEAPSGQGPKKPFQRETPSQMDLPGGPKAPKTTLGTRFREKIEDSWIRVKKLTETKGAKVSEGADPYQAETLMHGRIGDRLNISKKLVDKIDKDIVSTSKKLNIGDAELMKDVHDYAISKHVPERNAVKGEGAAGMTTAEAAQVRAEIEGKPNFKDVERISNDLKEFHKQTLDILLESEVIDQKTYKTLRKTYKEHVPLNREIDLEFGDIGDLLTSKGLDVRGTGLKRSKGSDLPIADITENIVSAHNQALMRAEKNLVDLNTVRFARANDYFGGMFKEIKPKVKDISKSGEPILEQITDPTVLPFRENGKQGYLKIKDPQLATALRGVNKEYLPELLNIIPKFTRFYGGLNTRFNPGFALTNKIRDMQEAVMFGASQKEVGYSGAAKSFAKDPQSILSVTEGLLGKDTPGAKLYAEMRAEGGTVGGWGLTSKEQLKLDINKIRKTNRSNPRKAAAKVLDSIELWNTIFEDSTRLGQYREAKAGGASKKRAAVIAKNSTLNFNKMGTGGPVINALWMFSNAGIQGSAKGLRAMKNPKVAVPVTTAVGTSIMTSNDYNDKKDPGWKDKISKFDLNRGLNIVLSGPDDEKFEHITIPASYSLIPMVTGFNFLHDAITGKKNSAKDVTEGLLASVVESYNPVGGGTDLGSILSPTITDVPLELLRNKSFTGGKIKPDFDKFAPESTKYFEKERESELRNLTVKGTKKLAEKTGIEISPADINYAIKQYGGGAGSFAVKAGKAIAGERDLSKLPFSSRLFRSKNVDEFVYNKAEVKDIKERLAGQSKDRFYESQAVRDAFKKFREEPSTKDVLLGLLKDKKDVRKVLNLVKKEKRNPTYSLVSKLGVDNWNRADYIRDRLAEMDTKEDKAAFYKIMMDDGYANKKVNKQLLFLLNKGK